MTEQTPVAEASETPSILLVDDVPSNLRVLYESLNGHNYRLLIANSGAQALDVARRTRPDLMLLDIMMPDMDGFEVCREIKDDPLTQRIAVIFLSALEETADKVRGLALGAVDYITKPFHPEEVTARVEAHCTILRLERALASQNRQLQLVRDRILHSMSEGIIGIDEQGQVSFANPAARQILGVDDRTLHNRDFRNCTPARLREAVQRVLAGEGEVSVADLQLPRPGGEPLHAELHVAPIRESAQTAGAVMVLRDLSARRLVEARLERAHSELLASHRELKDAQLQLIQAAKLESVGRLAAGVAHEVKNPLAIIQLGLDFLEQGLHLDPTSAGVFGEMQIAVSRADGVVRGLLDFARESELDLRPDSINRIVLASLQMIRHELTQRHIELAIELSEPIPRGRFDADKLQQVFLNLFMNAMYAMDRDGVLRVKSDVAIIEDHPSSRTSKAGFRPGERAIRVRVEDSGPGIASDNLARLFDPFFTTKPTGDGTGLGLSVSHNIVNLHRGSIDIGNRAGGGACATLLFRPDDEDRDG